MFSTLSMIILTIVGIIITTVIKNKQHVIQTLDGYPRHGTKQCDDNYVKALGVKFQRAGRSEQDAMNKPFV
eukprot:1382925-Pyramimonas_sp.AAC.1